MENKIYHNYEEYLKENFPKAFKMYLKEKEEKLKDSLLYVKERKN